MIKSICFSLVTPSSSTTEDDPYAAISKTWSIFSASATSAFSALSSTVESGAKIAVTGASQLGRQIQESVDQEGIKGLGNSLGDMVLGIGKTVAGTVEKGVDYIGKLSNEREFTRVQDSPTSNFSPTAQTNFITNSPDQSKPKKSDGWDDGGWEEF